VQLKAVMTVEPAACDGRSRSGGRLTALEPIANRPIVHHVLDSLRLARIDQLIVAGDADALLDLRECLREYGPGFDAIEYVPCRDGVDFQSTLDAVAPLVGDAPCLIHPADGLLEMHADHAGAVFVPDAPELVLFVAGGGPVGPGHPERRRAAIVRAEPDRRGQGVADIALFGPGMLGRAREAASGERSDLAATTERLAARGATVRVERVDSWRRYRGDGHDLLELNRVVLDRLIATTADLAVGSNRFEGRICIDPSADVRDSVIIGPTVIGPGATINQAYVGPYTSIGAGARIEGVEIERSIVARGARVSHVGVRMVSSLIGRDVEIFRDFSLPRALRLWVGDGDEVALC
jgi:glucose-1-phosphate thymidylyltransferase